MAFARSNAFNADMNQDLLALIESFQYDPYGVRATSGYRPGDSRQHGRGNALDLELIDPNTGKALENYQDPSTFGAYQQYANALYKHALQNNPELAQKLRWGGYFSGGKDVYGALDLMHFDVAGDQIGMGGGSWEQGLTPEQAKEWGLQAGGGIGQLDAQLEAAGYTPEQRRNAIASIESAGSGDYKALGAWTGDPKDGRDRAYGRYQVMGSNIGPWAEQYLKKSGVTADQFLADPALQDQLFDAVYGGYVNQYGERGAASKWFTGSEKEPQRTDVNGKLTGGTYADKYMAALGGPVKPAAGPLGSEGSTVNPTGSLKDAVTAAKKDDKDKLDKYQSLAEQAMEGLGGMLGGGGDAKTQMARLPQQAPQTPLPMDAMPIVQGGGGGRDNLAALMAQLNSGRLWG